MPIFPPTQRCNAVPAVSDLASSIPTGRYHSQKDRLGCSQVGHVMYLVEGDLREQQTLSPGRRPLHHSGLNSGLPPLPH